MRAAPKQKSARVQDTLGRVRRGERIVLRRGSKPVAALVSIADLRLLERLEDEEDRLDVEAAREALEEIKVSGTVPWEKVKADLGL